MYCCRWATILVSVYAVHHVGWANIIHKVSVTMGAPGFDPLANPKFGVTFIVWQILLWFSIHTCWQTTAMRMFFDEESRNFQAGDDLDGFSSFWGAEMLPMLWGIAALTLFLEWELWKKGIPRPVVNGVTLTPIDAMPAMLASMLGPGVKGIVIAGCWRRRLSVNSSYLLGWSAVISQDVILPTRQILG